MIKPNSLIGEFRTMLRDKWGYIMNTAGEMWTAAKQRSLELDIAKKYGSDWKNSAKAQEDSLYLSAVYGEKWDGHMVTDCSGAFSYSFRKLGGKMYHGSNTMYREWCTAKGTLKAGKKSGGAEILPGTAVFTGTENDHPHVGLYCGNGEVIEAQGTKSGVVSGKITNSKWKYWGELKGVDYSEYESAKPPTGQEESGWTPAQPQSEITRPGEPATRPTLRKGDKGEWVTVLQTKLLNLGYDLGSWGADGDFGKATESAVKAFQRASGLKDDGIVGKLTWAALDQQNEPITYTVTITGLTADQANELVKQFPDKATMKKGGA